MNRTDDLCKKITNTPFKNSWFEKKVNFPARDEINKREILLEELNLIGIIPNEKIDKEDSSIYIFALPKHSIYHENIREMLSELHTGIREILNNPPISSEEKDFIYKILHRRESLRQAVIDLKMESFFGEDFIKTIEDAIIPKTKRSPANQNVKSKIANLKEFEYWHISFTKQKIFVYFSDKRENIELCPADFGNRTNEETPKTFINLLKILEFKDAGRVNTYQLQDINDKMGKLFNTELRFFVKNEPMPFRIESERSKFDRQKAANREHTQTRKGEFEDSEIDEQADANHATDNASTLPEDEENPDISDYCSRVK
jgi:hypothetical protein